MATRESQGPAFQEFKWEVLTFLDESPSTVSRIAHDLHVEPQLARQLVADLTEGHYVKAKPSGSTGPYADKVAYLTGRGRRKLAQLKGSSEGVES